jgi:hypothetical protein
MKTLLILVAVSVAQPAHAQLAVKNFREIFDSLQVSTGVDPTDPGINAYYAQSYTRLPMTGAVAEVTSPGLLTFTAISGMFCQVMVANDAKLVAAQRRATGPVDFTQGPKALTADIEQAVIENYFGLFLSRSPSAAELQLLQVEFTDVIKELSDKATETPTALTAVCTSVASSLESLLL